MTAPDGDVIGEAVTFLEDTLREALKGVLRVTASPSDSITVPTLVIAPPELSWGAFNTANPIEGTFTLAVVVPRDERAVRKLYGLIPKVAAAVHTATGASVSSASPGTWTAGGAPLPAYLIEIEAPLT